MEHIAVRKGPDNMEKTFIHNRFKELKLQRKYKSARAIAEALKINRHAINKVLGGDISSDRDQIIFRSILELIDIPEEEFFQRVQVKPDAPKRMEPDNRVPLLGSIPAGHAVSVEGITEAEDYVPLPLGMKAGKLFALKVKGASMQPYLEDGDIVYLEELGFGIGPKDPERPAPKNWFDPLHGRIIATVRNGDATLKMLQVKALGNGQFDLYLMPINTDYPPVYITESCDVLFQGVVVSVHRDASRVLHSHLREIPNAK